jgi:hypothetical protein
MILIGGKDDLYHSWLLKTGFMTIKNYITSKRTLNWVSPI